MTPDLDPAKVGAFAERIVDELGATLNAALVVIGDALGLYRAMAGAGGVTAGVLAERTGTSERYVREWLNAQAAGGYVEYDAQERRYSLPPEHAAALADAASPHFVPGAFELGIACLRDEPRIREAFLSGAGLGRHERDHGVLAGCEGFLRPGYAASLVPTWIPALEGVEDKLRTGASVADVGCGLGASTILMAQAFPASSFAGFDEHPATIDGARDRAGSAGLSARVRFEVAPAAAFPGDGYDLVTMFDCLHDLGDPVGSARHVRESLADDGTWLVVEPFAGDRVEDNLDPVGRVYYAASTLLCTPASLSQDVGLALGAQAGESQLRDVARSAGFSRFRRAARTPFNLVLEARP